MKYDARAPVKIIKAELRKLVDRRFYSVPVIIIIIIKLKTYANYSKIVSQEI